MKVNKRQQTQGRVLEISIGNHLDKSKVDELPVENKIVGSETFFTIRMITD
jgi:hypothetical protein